MRSKVSNKECPYRLDRQQPGKVKHEFVTAATMRFSLLPGLEGAAALALLPPPQREPRCNILIRIVAREAHFAISGVAARRVPNTEQTLADEIAEFNSVSPLPAITCRNQHEGE